MIKVNGRNVDWEEGMTIETVLEKCSFTYPAIVVSVNGTVIYKDKYAASAINDGDDVKVIHLVAGG